MTGGTAQSARMLQAAQNAPFNWDDWNARLDAALARYEAAETAIHQAHMSVIADLREILGDIA